MWKFPMNYDQINPCEEKYFKNIEVWVNIYVTKCITMLGLTQIIFFLNVEIFKEHNFVKESKFF
jgi:hypothetical protein